MLNLSDQTQGGSLADVTSAAAAKVFENADATVRIRAMSADGGLIENDWRENPNGEGYLRRLGSAGRSTLQDSLNLHLAPKVEAVNRDFAKRYGWDRPAGGGEPGSGPSTPSGSPAETGRPLATTPPDKGRPSANEQGGGSALPTAGKTERVAAVDEQIQRIQTRIDATFDKFNSAKARNSAAAEKALAELKAAGVDTTDAQDALDEYRDTVRSDLGGRASLPASSQGFTMQHPSRRQNS